MNRVELGWASFLFCWLCILVVHAAATAFYVFVTTTYLQMHQNTALADFLGYYSIGMSSQHYRAIAAVHSGCAVLHGICVFSMLSGSLVRCRPSFQFALPEWISLFASISFASDGNIHSSLCNARAWTVKSRGFRRLSCLASTVVLVFNRVFGSSGWLGIHGKHYGTLLLCRELLETSMQTAQAYQMARLLPRETLNRMYLALIVLNCWITVIVRAVMSKRTLHERFFSLLVDCVLDLASSVGIPLTVVLYYLGDYDWTVGGFPFELSINDKWFVRAKNEMQIVFVTSWGDLATRVVFACLLQVRPWGEAMPFCSLVELNCNRFHISGASQEVEAMWRQFGRATVERVVIRHCAALQMPPLLQEFTSLNTLKVYNTTIVEWGAEAAITAVNHPSIALIYLVRVSVPDGAVPAGLLSSDTLSTLDEITFCVTNLRQLPKDLDSRWPKGIAINLEFSQLTAVPDGLLRLQPWSLSLYGNPIDSLPSALFESEGLFTLSVGASNVAALPETVRALSSSLSYVSLTNTSASFFWAWIDPMLTTRPGQLYLFSTPYCAEYARILDGSAANFSALPPSDAPYSLLMDAEGHWKEVTTHISCNEYDAQPVFPLVTEDALAGTADG